MGDSENFEGRDVGSGISVIRESTDVVGSGPRLHRHPCTETFVIIRGHARFTHKFAVPVPDEAVHIHESDHFVTEWLA